MNKTLIAKAIPLFAAFLAGGAVVWWLVGSGDGGLKERLPGEDRAEGEVAAASGPTKWEGKLVKGSGAPANLNGVWPRFRGPNWDGISTEQTPLAKSWPASGPKALWKMEVGEGFAGVAIWKGRVFLTDYDREGKADALRCLSLADGQEIWRYTYPCKVKRNHGMSRTIPAVTDKYTISLGPKCQVLCVDTATGEFRWELNLVREFDTEVPPWYAGQCPFVDGDRLILGTGGKALVIAVDCATGKVLWRSPNPRRWQMTHSSIAPMEFQGRRMYVYCGSGGVAGVSATDGAILWDTRDWKISIANIPTPLPVGNGRVFLSGGYDAGSMMLQLKEAGGKLSAEPLFRLKAAVFGAVQQTPIFHQNHIFGVRPDGQLVCLGLDGKIVWASSARNKFGSAPFMIAQGMIYVMNDNGALTLVEATTAGYKQLARAQVLEGPDAWGPLALADGRLVARDLHKMVCLDVAAH